MIARLKDSLRNINYRLFIILIITGLAPTIYTTIRIYFIGQLPDDSGFNIASQLSWLGVMFEVVEEALFLPLYFFIAKEANNQKNMSNKVRTGLIFIFFLYFSFSALLIILAKPLLILMAQNEYLINESATYISLESIAMIFSALYRFITIVLISMQKQKLISIFLLIQIILIILLDTLFISTLNISLNLGINGIAITNIIVNSLLFLISVFYLNKNHLKIFCKEALNFSWIKELIKIGSLSGIESFIRNLFFVLMIIRMVNVIGEQGTFWVANKFIWGWLLLPILQLGELIKRDSAENKNNISKNTLGYFFITAIIILLWFVTIPLWKVFMKNILSISNYEDVFFIVIISIFAYMLFAFNNILDSIFYGRGKTDYMLFQSVMINVLLYGSAFTLYKFGIYKPTLVSTALMFATGITLDSILTFFIFRWMIKKQNIKILSYNEV